MATLRGWLSWRDAGCVAGWAVPEGCWVCRRLGCPGGTLRVSQAGHRTSALDFLIISTCILWLFSGWLGFSIRRVSLGPRTSITANCQSSGSRTHCGPGGNQLGFPQVLQDLLWNQPSHHSHFQDFPILLWIWRKEPIFQGNHEDPGGA